METIAKSGVQGSKREYRQQLGNEVPGRKKAEWLRRLEWMTLQVCKSASLTTDDAVAYDRVDEKTNVWFLTVVDKHG